MNTIKRGEAIRLLKEKCLSLVDDEHSLCEVAARRKVFCGGFSQWTFGELKERYDWIVARNPRITRAELEELANRWQLARQFVSDCNLSCDNQLGETHHQTCKGWDEFKNEELALYCKELCDRELQVVPDEPVEESVQDSAR